MNNLLSYFGLVDPRIRASEKDLPVCNLQFSTEHLKKDSRNLLEILALNTHLTTCSSSKTKVTGFCSKIHLRFEINDKLSN